MTERESRLAQLQANVWAEDAAIERLRAARLAGDHVSERAAADELVAACKATYELVQTYPDELDAAAQYAAQIASWEAPRC